MKEVRQRIRSTDLTDVTDVEGIGNGEWGIGNEFEFPMMCERATLIKLVGIGLALHESLMDRSTADERQIDTDATQIHFKIVCNFFNSSKSENLRCFPGI